MDRPDFIVCNFMENSMCLKRDYNYFYLFIYFFSLLQIFTFSIQIMFSLISSEANDPQRLMYR